MNLVDAIQGQLTSQMTGKLASLIGGSEAQTKTAVGAAVPAMLSALSGVASSSSGADKLSKALGGFDAGTLGNLAGMFSQSPDKALDKGNSLLGSLLGGTALSGLAGALAKIVGFNSGIVTKLLGYLPRS